MGGSDGGGDDEPLRGEPSEAAGADRITCMHIQRSSEQQPCSCVLETMPAVRERSELEERASMWSELEERAGCHLSSLSRAFAVVPFALEAAQLETMTCG